MNKIHKPISILLSLILLVSCAIGAVWAAASRQIIPAVEELSSGIAPPGSSSSQSSIDAGLLPDHSDEGLAADGSVETPGGENSGPSLPSATQNSVSKGDGPNTEVKVDPSSSAVSSSPAISRPNTGGSSRPGSSSAVSRPGNSTSSESSGPVRPSGSGKYVVGYYPSWAASSGLAPSSVQASMLTHLNYAFASLNAQQKLVLANPQTDRRNFEGLRALKQKYPHLKTLISVGGWDYSSHFSAAAATVQARQTFAQSCVDFILEHGFDGVDIDWEFPSSKDRQNFTLLLQEVRGALDRQSAKDGKTYWLTIAVGAGQTSLKNIEVQKAASLVDYFFLMGYDIHGPWDSYADLNAPLYTPKENSPHYKLSVSQAVWNYRNAGVPASKLVMGMPFYGYQYTTKNSTANGLYSPFTSAKSISFDRVKANYLGNSQFRSYYHETAQVPYLFDGTTFLTYEDETSIAHKAAFARSQGLAGVGAWDLSHDKQAVLLKSAYQTFLSQ